MAQIISAFDTHDGKLYSVVKDEMGYHVICDGTKVQPNHSAEGIIRYLSNFVHNSEYMLSKNETI